MKANLEKVKQILWARFSLRRCTEVGPFPRLDGRVIVHNSGRMVIGEKVRIRGSHVPVELATYPSGELIIGDRTGINGGTSICAQQSVVIGKNCLIGNYTLIMDTDFHVAGDYSKAPEAAPIRIGDNVWIAAHVTILKGVTIGEGAVVSAGSVVAMDVPAYTLVGGVPARAIRRLDRPAPDASVPVPETAASTKAVTA